MGYQLLKKLFSGAKFRPIRGGQAASVSSRLVGFINQLINTHVPAYQGGASWRQSRRWGGFANRLKASLWLKGGTGGLATGVESLAIAILAIMALPNSASAAPSITLAQPTNPVNINVPTDGGIGVGGHTLTIKATGTAGYDLTMQASNSSLTNTKDSNQTIPTVTASTTNNGNDPVKLTANTWGYNFTTGNKTGVTDNTAATWLPIPATAKSIKTTTIDSPAAGDSYYLTYGVNVPKVDNTMIKTGNYTTTITYTATAKIPAPTITKLDPNTAQLATTADSTTKLTITGTNLSTTAKAWIDLDKDKAYDEVEKCAIQGTPTDTSLSCSLPNGNTIAAGQYDVYVETQGGTSTAGTGTKFTYTPASDFNQSTDGNVTVEYDKNMVPVKWDTTKSAWVTVSKADIAKDPHNWYQYGKTADTKHWANAVTMDSAANAQKYANGNSGVAVPEANIRGYWVYIPRYSYTVLRFNASDTVVQPTNFTITWQTKKQKSIPTANGQQATHPAFSWCTSPNYTNAANTTGCTELAGFWMGKFETTGSISAPTVKPGLSSVRSQTVGTMFDSAKKIGPADANATGGSDSGATQNYHNLSNTGTDKVYSHMLKNSEWGAAAYLSASDYGTGVNNVQINSNSSYVTGGGDYVSNVNQSTTGNVYGIYDMSGGAFEYVMGAYSTSTTQVANDYSSYYGTAMKPPYVDLYPSSIFTYSESNSGYWNNYNVCTWATCGGAALHETLTVQSVSSNGSAWGSDESYFVTYTYPWFIRGGRYDNGSYAGAFAALWSHGDAGSDSSFRAALVAL